MPTFKNRRLLILATVALVCQISVAAACAADREDDVPLIMSLVGFHGPQRLSAENPPGVVRLLFTNTSTTTCCLVPSAASRYYSLIPSDATSPLALRGAGSSRKALRENTGPVVIDDAVIIHAGMSVVLAYDIPWLFNSPGKYEVEISIDHSASLNATEFQSIPICRGQTEVSCHVLTAWDNAKQRWIVLPVPGNMDAFDLENKVSTEGDWLCVIGGPVPHPVWHGWPSDCHGNTGDFPTESPKLGSQGFRSWLHNGGRFLWARLCGEDYCVLRRPRERERGPPAAGGPWWMEEAGGTRRVPATDFGCHGRVWVGGAAPFPRWQWGL